MVFVNTSKEVALERNQMRERKLADEMVSKMWQDVQNNMGKFQRLFGSKYTLIVDNSSSEDNSIINLAGKEIAKHLSTPIENNLGKIWIKNELENKKRS